MRKDWEVYSIKVLGKIVTGSTPSTKNELNYSSNDYSFVKPSDISQSQISYIDETECYVSEYAFQNSRILPSGAVLVTCIGIIGKVGIVVNDCICNQQINAIIPNEKVNNKFLAYSIFSKKEMLALIANAPVVPIINKNDFSNIKLSVPPLQTQQQIVEELDCLTSIIEKQKKQLEELDNLAQSIFYDMFGDPIENEKGWEFKKIEDLCSVVGGSTPKTNIPEYWDGDNYWVTPAELNEKYISSTIRSITDKGVKSANLKMLPKGTVLFTSRAPIGKVSITRAPMFCNQGFKNFICSDIIINEYLYHVLLYNTEYLNSLGVGATFKEVSKSKISSVRISLPPLSLQQEFASKIEAIEKQKELIKKSIKETEDLFNSRMDYYFN